MLDTTASIGNALRARIRGAKRLLLCLLSAVPALASGAVYESPSSPAASPRYVTFREATGQDRVTADFRSLGGASLSVSFSVASEASRASMATFGYSRDDIERIARSCVGCSPSELDRRMNAYFQNHKLRMRQVRNGTPHLFVDIPEVVREDRANVRSVAQALRELGERGGHDSEWVADAAIALVQTGLAYRSPSDEVDGRKTLGFYTPSRALEVGYGDCDTKSALLAAILLELGESQVIGVHLASHYLLGIDRAPRVGDATIEFQGRTWVLVEAAGPAFRRPGEVGTVTRTALADNDGLRIDPMF